MNITRSACLLLLAATCSGLGACRSQEQTAATKPAPQTGTPETPANSTTPSKDLAMANIDPKTMTDEQWRKILTPEQYRIMRQKGTERAFSGKYWNHFEKGYYRCAACKVPLFTSEQKFESSCGWPAFSASVSKEAINDHVDTSFGMVRTENTCSNCGAHLGHVFDDGPPPTGIRYCVNSESIEFISADKAKEELAKLPPKDAPKK